jgi:hypothetical protein
MKIVLGLCFALLAGGCATQPEQSVALADSTTTTNAQGDDEGLPPDAAQVVDKLAACTHFAGEFGGDKSQRDREVAAAIVQLHCETIDQDVLRIVTKYPGNKKLVDALKVASQEPLPESR